MTFADLMSCKEENGVHACGCGPGLIGSAFEAAIDGLKGTCVDVNECASDPCGDHSMCRNTDGGFECTCRIGFLGDGYECSPVLELSFSSCFD